VQERRQTAYRLVDLVAGRLGNTRTVCRSCYIHPAVFEDWEDETLAGDMAATGRRRAARRHLDATEARALSWLRSKTACA